MDRLLDFGFSNIELWRSEEMQLVQLIVPAESAHDTVAALGEVGLLQFKDMNAEKSAFQRTYANQVKRCDEMARKLRFFSEQLTSTGGLASPFAPDTQAAYNLDELEAKLEELEKEMLEVNSNNERLQRSHSELDELRLVLEKAGHLFDKSRLRLKVTPADNIDVTPDVPLLEQGGDKMSRVGFVAGTIPTDKLNAFERLLFRATRGNMYLRHDEIGKVRDPTSGETLDKSVFVIFYAGERSKYKVMKICEAFGANRYPFPEDVDRQRQMQTDVMARLRELASTVEGGERHRKVLLESITSSYSGWTSLVRRELAIYHTLNKLSVDTSHKVLVAEAWVPTSARGRVSDVLRAAAANSSTQLHAVLQPMAFHEAPPTYYQTNRFTSSFQNIVESYGVAKYREVNPTVLTLMTFPFLFAVMFGDIGHALLMLAVAVIMLVMEKKLLKMDLGDMLGMLFGGRYLILLMALFSIYTGFIYNEFFSMPLTFFGATRWRCFASFPGQPLDIADMRACVPNGGVIKWPPGQTPYAVGVDPLWHGCKTELPFINSVKMKMSILMGVTHMNAGIFMSMFNNLFYRDYLSLICEFIPQMIFLNSIFGYLCFLIVKKWVSGRITDLFHVLIYMFLKPGTVDAAGYLFEGQAGLQVFLILIALFAVPWMLLPKPLILKKRAEAIAKAKGHTLEMSPLNNGMPDSAEVDEDGDDERRPLGGGSMVRRRDSGHGGGGGHDGHGEHFDFGEVAVHQMIHTIEFVLGAVSNTASYLRLWALSLAHSQLSSVFYDRVLMAGIASGNIVAIFIGFFVFFCATLGVLMVMESLSAFLHALRLHWVEYQGKFYKGDGYLFAPFDFNRIEADEKEAS